jgi:hypothetical protein
MRAYYVEQVLPQCGDVKYTPDAFWCWIETEFNVSITGLLREPKLRFNDETGYTLFMLRFS